MNASVDSLRAACSASIDGVVTSSRVPFEPRTTEEKQKTPPILTIVAVASNGGCGAPDSAVPPNNSNELFPQVVAVDPHVAGRTVMPWTDSPAETGQSSENDGCAMPRTSIGTEMELERPVLFTVIVHVTVERRCAICAASRAPMARISFGAAAAVDRDTCNA